MIPLAPGLPWSILCLLVMWSHAQRSLAQVADHGLAPITSSGVPGSRAAQPYLKSRDVGQATMGPLYVVLGTCMLVGVAYAVVQAQTSLGSKRHRLGAGMRRRAGNATADCARLIDQLSSCESAGAMRSMVERFGKQHSGRGSRLRVNEANGEQDVDRLRSLLTHELVVWLARHEGLSVRAGAAQANESDAAAYDGDMGSLQRKLEEAELARTGLAADLNQRTGEARAAAARADASDRAKQIASDELHRVKDQLTKANARAAVAMAGSPGSVAERRAELLSVQDRCGAAELRVSALELELAQSRERISAEVSRAASAEKRVEEATKRAEQFRRQAGAALDQAKQQTETMQQERQDIARAISRVRAAASRRQGGQQGAGDTQPPAPEKVSLGTHPEPLMRRLALRLKCPALDPVRPHAEGLCATARAVLKQPMPDLRLLLADLDRFVYTRPIVGSGGGAPGTLGRDDIALMVALQVQLALLLSEAGFVAIEPTPGEPFDPASCLFDPDDAVLINSEPDRHGRVHSCIRPGYRLGSTVLRRAVVRRYVYHGASLEEQGL